MMMVTTDRLHERCQGCSKNILKHNKFASCHNCSKIAHAKCAQKIYSFDQVHDYWTCWECNSNTPQIYNPFDSLFQAKHLQDDSEALTEINQISQILKKCENHSSRQVNNILKNPNVTSILFNNIDGLTANFDTLSTELSTLENKFSIITFAETNLDAEHKDLFNLNGYQSVFQSKTPNKNRGSGLAIYIEDKFLHTTCDESSQCSKNLESLFINVSNTIEPILVGVIYRPPSGNIDQFLSEFEKLLSKLPSKNVYITGDFNIDLHKRCAQLSKFENIFFGNGLLPTISRSTHCKPGCNPSCIDNIFVKSVEPIAISGIFETAISHHSPIFCIIDNTLSSIEPEQKQCPKYDYCESNLDKFSNEIENKLSMTMENTDTSTGFSEFCKTMKNAIEECFLTDPRTLKSKRNRLVNPWITSGIIASVNKKNFLYQKWKKSTSKKDKTGDHSLYTAYKDFRKKLKHIIGDAKKMHYFNKFQSVQGDCKKTWQLINEIRGKKISKIKPSFIINGEIIEDRRKIANGFNHFFVSIASKLNASIETYDDGIPITPISNFRDYMGKSISSSITCQTVQQARSAK